MGHYDSCRDETWAVKDTKCSKAKDKKHKWVEESYGIQQCKHCKHVIYYT